MKENESKFWKDEYEFEYSRISRNDVEKLYATNITGVKRGLLMCETRKTTENNRPSRNAE